MKDKNARICIIGAGPAGLTAAETLKDLGFKHVIVLERRDRAGGQSLSRSYITPSNEKIIYELGSVMPFGSGIAQTLIKKYGLHYGRTFTLSGPAYFKLYDLETGNVVLDFTRYRFGKPITPTMWLPFLRDMIEISRALWRYRVLAGPGYHQLSKEYAKELEVSDHEWVDKQQFEIIGDDLKTAMGSMLSFANATYEDIPASKFLKFLYQLLRHPIRYINGSYLPIREGYQELWNRVAKAHDVRMNVNILSIEREGKKISVKTAEETFEFDYLIITCQPKEILALMNHTQSEQIIFNKVKFCPGWRAAFVARGMPFDAAYNIPHPYKHQEVSGLSLFVPEGKVEDDAWLYTCTLSQNKINDLSELQALAEEVLKNEFNARDIKWVDSTNWPEYGSYFAPNEITRGIYKEIDHMQGENNTYYLGELISGGSHCVVSTHADYLIKREFG